MSLKKQRDRKKEKPHGLTAVYKHYTVNLSAYKIFEKPTNLFIKKLHIVHLRWFGDRTSLTTWL